MVKLGHFLVEVLVAPLIQRTQLGVQVARCHIHESFSLTLLHDAHELLLNISQPPVVCRVLETLHPMLVRLAICNVDSLSVSSAFPGLS